jgi:hypothetical protein
LESQRLSIAYGVTRVCAGLGATIIAKLRAGLSLNAAPCLASSVGDGVGIDRRTGARLVGALRSDQARESRDGEGGGGVEHDDCELWRSGPRVSEPIQMNSQPAVPWQSLRECANAYLGGCVCWLGYQWQMRDKLWMESVLGMVK